MFSASLSNIQSILCLTFVFVNFKNQFFLSRKSCQISFRYDYDEQARLLSALYLFGIWVEFIRRKLRISKTRKKPIADTDISKIFKSCFLLHYQEYNVFHALPFFRAKIFQIVAISIFCYGFQLIWLMLMLLLWLRRSTRAPWFILSVSLWNRTC